MRELGIHAVDLTSLDDYRNSKFDKQLINILDEQSIHCDQTPFGALTPLIFQFMIRLGQVQNVGVN